MARKRDHLTIMPAYGRGGGGMLDWEGGGCRWVGERGRTFVFQKEM